MKKETVIEEVSRQYRMAHDKHYTEKDLFAALQIYKRVVAMWADSKEAEYSRTQIQNIFWNVVPNGVIYDSQMKMALMHVKVTKNENQHAL